MHEMQWSGFIFLFFKFWVQEALEITQKSKLAFLLLLNTYQAYQR